MSDIDQLFNRANLLIDKLEAILPGHNAKEGLNAAAAMRWRCKDRRSWLEPVKSMSDIQLDDLKYVDRQKQEIIRNTRQFLHSHPANNVLLWGPRGTGKSSLIKALLNRFSRNGLRLIEVEGHHLLDLHDICDQIRGLDGRFIIYCDDLSFAADDPSYKALKVILDGSISTTPENVLIYATSNRRHLMPEYMSENMEATYVEGELHLGETTEEKISLSERFGIWLSFHPFTQEQYLGIVDYWVEKLHGTVIQGDDMHKLALRWALEHGSRSGRTAWQFARDWTGRQRLEQSGEV